MAVHHTLARSGSSRLNLTPARVAGWSGIGMLVAIIVNGPLSALRGLPDYWSVSAAADLGRYLADPPSLRLAVLFFFLSTLIFVFGIPFMAGLRVALRAHGSSDLFPSVLVIGAGLFFAGGLVSEVMSTGMAMVVLAAPSYVADANAALALQALQFAALLQAQVGLGVAILAVSVAMWRAAGWRAVAIVGVFAGAIDLARPLAVAMPVLAIALFVPTFVWIALASLRLIRADD
jgi:hypothetical protein